MGDHVMRYGFLDIAATPGVRAAQTANGSADLWGEIRSDRSFDRFTTAESAFIASRDSFYMATVSETGWPYVQHRGGPPGFLRVIDEQTLAFADYRGNRQYISVGNLAANDRVCLFLIDYPRRARLKIYARAETRDLRAIDALVAKLATPGYRARAERAFVLTLSAFRLELPAAHHSPLRRAGLRIDSGTARGPRGGEPRSPG